MRHCEVGCAAVLYVLLGTERWVVGQCEETCGALRWAVRQRGRFSGREVGCDAN